MSTIAVFAPSSAPTIATRQSRTLSAPEAPTAETVERLLDRIAFRLTPDLLPSFGVGRKSEREEISRYYLLRATPRGVALRETNLLVRIETGESDDFYATLGHLDGRLIDQLCWMIVCTYEGQSWLHLHILQLWPVDALPPLPGSPNRHPENSDVTHVFSQGIKNRSTARHQKRRPRKRMGDWRTLPVRLILDMEDLL